MARAIRQAKFTRKAFERRQHRAARSPARGLAVGLALSIIAWLGALVAWLHFHL